MPSSCSNPIFDALERIRLTTFISSEQWFDLLNLTPQEYLNFNLGTPSHSANTYSAIENVAACFQFDPKDLINNRIDFVKLALDNEPRIDVRESYLTAAFGRRRATINAIGFVEQVAGWRLRLDIKRKFGLTEAHLLDPFSPISIRLITEVCDYLMMEKSFGVRDFFVMGVDSYAANRDTIIGKIVSEGRSVAEAYELFFVECLKLMERNCRYDFAELGPEHAVMEVRSNSDAAQGLGVRHVGSKLICEFKAGILASIPWYLKRTIAHVQHSKCVHRGDLTCRFEIRYQR